MNLKDEQESLGKIVFFLLFLAWILGLITGYFASDLFLC